LKIQPLFGLIGAAILTTALANPALAGYKEGAKFEFRNGYPSIAASQELYDELDYQRAVQAYIWATPMLNSMGWRDGFERIGITSKNRKLFVLEDSAHPQLTAMTANQITPYAFILMDLREDGPMVVEVPPKDYLGGFVDFWHRALGDIGFIGPDRGKGGKYLVLPPGYEGEVPAGYHVVLSTSNQTFFYARANSPKFKGPKALEVYGKMRIYPLSEAANPPSSIKLMPMGHKPFSQDWPKTGLAVWESIHKGIQLDNIREQDKPFYDSLRDLGIEHGKPFNPTERQKKILLKAAELGHKMVVNYAFNHRKRFAWRWDDRTWKTIFVTQSPNHETETYTEVMDRASAWYQLTMTAKYPFDARKRPPVYGKGSAYLANYQDSDGEFLDGANSYRLRVPADVPAANFWNVTVYHNETRAMINNEQGVISLGSPDDLERNVDGTVDLYFGPERPKDKKNWIQTNKDEGWFVLFRFFGPEKGFYDRTWILPDFEKLN
jgi:hypothetical protein